MRSFAFDFVRVVSTFLVVMLHVASPLLWDGYDPWSVTWLGANLLDSVGRMAVPVFVMLSGALLLGKNEPYGDFFKKRFTRVAIPLVAWTCIYLFLKFWKLGGFTGNAWDVVAKLPNPLRDPVSVHLWYLYMILGLYLVTPLLRRVLPSLQSQDLWYALGIWVVFQIVFPMVKRHLGYQPNLIATLLTPYLGYYVAGYALRHYAPGPGALRWLWLGMVAGCFGTVALTLAESLAMGSTQTFYSWYHSPTVVLQGFCGFLLLMHYGAKWSVGVSDKTGSWFQSLGVLTFGVYLIHPLFLGWVSRAILPEATIVAHPAYAFFGIIVAAGLLTTVSLGFTWILSRIPFVKAWV